MFIESNKFAIISICNECESPIHKNHVYIAYESLFYHQSCFRCHICCVPFSDHTTLSSNNIESHLKLTTLPCINQKNKLFCSKDFISANFSCRLCLKSLTETSRIYQLNGMHESSNNLVHVECVACTKCDLKINPSDEYSLIEKNDSCFIYCKSCTLDTDTSKSNKAINTKKRSGNKHRLSSRQKEILKTKFSVNNLQSDEILSTKNTVILERLAKDMNCTPKSAAQYIMRHKHKLQELSKKNYIYKKESDFKIDVILGELKKLDNTIPPPNQKPFGCQFYVKKHAANLIQLLDDTKSSDIVPNVSPFE
jgi:hypothetical protein